MVVTGYHLSDKCWNKEHNYIQTYRVPYELQFMTKEELISCLEDIEEDRFICVDLVTKPI